MANEQNLIPVTKRSPREQKEISSKGGKASAEKKRQKRTFRDIFNAILVSDIPENAEIGETAKTIKENFDVTSIDDATAYAIVFKAMNGDIRAFEILRDTIGEKPTDKHQVDADTDFKITVEYM